MSLSETQALFDAGFAERFRYVLQQHERAMLARIRMRSGEFTAVIEANNYELRLTAGMYELSRFIDERFRAASAHPDSPHSPDARDRNTSVVTRHGTGCGHDETLVGAGEHTTNDRLGDPEE